MQADGTIVIDTTIADDGFKAGSKDIELAAKRMAKTVSNVGDKAKIALQKQLDAFSKLNAQYAAQEKKVEALKQKVEEFNNQKIPMEEYKAIQKQIDETEKKLAALTERQEKFVNTGGKTNSKAYAGMQYEIEQLKKTLEYAKAEKEDLEKSGGAFTSGADTPAAQKAAAQLETEQQKLEDTNNRLNTSFMSLKQKVKEYGGSLENAEGSTSSYSNSIDNAQKRMSALNSNVKRLAGGMTQKAADGIKKIGKNANSTALSLKNLIKYGLGIRSLYALFSKIRGALVDGFKNLAQYSGNTNKDISSLMSSLTQLKNSFATAFAPILSAVAPALNYLIGLLNTAVTAIAQFMAALTGKSTVVKATKVQQDYAKSLKKTGSAAKDAKEELAAFDKLNVKKDDSSSGNGGGSGGVSPSEMFETVAVSSALTKALDAVKKKWNDIAALFAKGFKVGLGDTTSRFATIISGLQRIKDSFSNIFSDAKVQNAAKVWGEKVVYDLGVIAGSIASIGVTLATNLIGGFAQYLEDAQDRIKQYIIDMFDITGDISDIVANFSEAFAYVFSAFSDENGQTFTANLIGFFSNAFMGVSELFVKTGRDFLDTLTTPFINNKDEFKSALDNILGVVAQVMGDIKDVFTVALDEINQAYDEHIAPMFDAFAEGFTKIYGSALAAFNTYILPALQKVADKFTEVKNQYLQPFFSSFADMVGQLADTLTAAWNQLLMPLLDWIVQTFAPLIGNAIENIGGFFNTFLSVVGAVGEGVTGVLTGLLEFIQGVLTLDIETALNGIKDIFKSVFNGIVALVEIAVNSIISGLNKISFDIPEWSPVAGGQHFGFDISTVRLPRLASGTVVPPRAGEFAAILGDNKKETEVVSPLSTMKQALKEALQESGGLGGGDIVGYIYLDGKEMGASTVKFVRQEKKRTGKNPVLV
nr:MAG TPA: minor tail protein [Caudoviricetes sp.]